jgi:O-antigen ligase
LVYSSTTYFGFVSERTWYFSALVEAMAVIAVFRPGFFSGKLSRLQLSVLFLLLVLALADSLGVDPRQSFFSTYLRLEGILLYLHLGLYFFVLTRISFSQQQWNAALLFSVSVALVVVIWGATQNSGWQAVDHRLVATVGNPAFLAAYLLMNLFLGVYLVTQLPRIALPIRLTVLGLVGVTLVTGIYLSGTRSALLALVLSGLYLAGATMWRHAQNWRVSLGWLALGLAILGGSFWLVSQLAFFQQFPIMYRLTHFSGEFNTFSPRFVCWKIGLDSFLDRPLLGWGQENFSYGFACNYDASLAVAGTQDWYDRTHNLFIDWLFSAGILGLSGYLFVWLCLVQRLRTKRNVTPFERVTLSSIFVSYFLFNLLNFDSLLSLQLFFILLAFVDTATSSTSPTSVSASTLSLRWLLPARIGVLTLAVTLFVYSVYRPYRTLRALDRQNLLTDAQQRIMALESIYNNEPGRQLDLSDAATSLTLSVLQSTLPPTTKQFCYQRSGQLVNEQLRQHPDYTRLMARAAALYLAGGESDKAIDTYRQINRLESNRRPSAFLQLGNALLAKQQFSQAIAVFDTASRLQPQWQEPLLYKALTFALQRDTSHCFATLRNISTETLINRLAFIKRIYAQTGNPHEFVNRVSQTAYKGTYPPAVFVEWALTAFDTHDLTQMTSAINSLYHLYPNSKYDYATMQQVISDGRRGIRPDRLTAMAQDIAQ